MIDLIARCAVWLTGEASLNQSHLDAAWLNSLRMIFAIKLKRSTSPFTASDILEVMQPDDQKQIRTPSTSVWWISHTESVCSMKSFCPDWLTSLSVINIGGVYWTDGLKGSGGGGGVAKWFRILFSPHVISVTRVCVHLSTLNHSFL